MTDVLVLNSAFVPIRTVSDQESICLLYSNKCFTVVETDRVMRSPSLILKIPSVIALIGYSELPKKEVTFTKLNVLYRDDLRCQYCGKKFSVENLTIDHVIPISRWYIEKKTREKDWNNWENCVCACKACNNLKGNRLLSELRWQLAKKPVKPKYLPHIVVSYEKAKRKNWLPFVQFNVRLIDMID